MQDKEGDKATKRSSRRIDESVQLGWEHVRLLGREPITRRRTRRGRKNNGVNCAGPGSGPPPLPLPFPLPEVPRTWPAGVADAPTATLGRQQLFATVRMLSRMVQNLKTRAPRKTQRNQPG